MHCQRASIGRPSRPTVPGILVQQHGLPMRWIPIMRLGERTQRWDTQRAASANSGLSAGRLGTLARDWSFSSRLRRRAARVQSFSTEISA